MNTRAAIARVDPTDGIVPTTIRGHALAACPPSVRFPLPAIDPPATAASTATEAPAATEASPDPEAAHG